MADDDLEYYPLPEGYGAEPTARIRIGPQALGEIASTDYQPDAFEAAAARTQARYPNVPRAIMPESATEGLLPGLTEAGRGFAAAPGNVGRMAESAMGAIANPANYATRPWATGDDMQAPPYVAPGQGSRAAQLGAAILARPAARAAYLASQPHEAWNQQGAFAPGADPTEAADLAAEAATSLVGQGMRFARPGGLGMAGSRMVQPTMDVPGRPGMGGLAAPPTLTPRNINKFTSGQAQRVGFPGVYQRPDVVAAQGAANVAPEHPALHALFNVHRDDLYGIGQQGRRQGNVDPAPLIWQPSKPTPNNYAAEALMNPRNAQRMVDTLAEAEKYPQLTHGMDAWYVMDPAYQRMVQLVGPEQAKRDYLRFNAIVPPFSAGSNVLTEINRGTAANMFAARGDYPSFVRYGGVKESARATTPGYPMEDLGDVKGHAYHGTQADPITRYLETGTHGFAQDTVKVPLYSLASGVPETGFQTRLPVPDAHFARAAGMADVRKSKDFDTYMGGSEYRQFGPWYRENVAKPLGLEAVPAQGRMWGVYAPQTGVDTPVGAPKLELLAQSIWERAQRLGIDPYKLRDDVLTGKGHAMLPFAAIPAGAAVMGGLAQQDGYQ